MRTHIDDAAVGWDQLSRKVALAAFEEFARNNYGKLGEPRTWFSLQQAAEYLSVAEQTLSKFVKEGVAPASVKIGGGRRFHRDALDAWIRAGGTLAFNKVGSVSAQGGGDE